MVALDEEDIVSLLEQSDHNPLHRRAFIMALVSLRNDGIKPPKSLWEFKVEVLFEAVYGCMFDYGTTCSVSVVKKKDVCYCNMMSCPPFISESLSGQDNFPELLSGSPSSAGHVPDVSLRL